MNEFQEKNSDEIRQILAKYPPEYKRSAVMPLLHIAQRRKGYVSPDDIRNIAEILDISSTDVASVSGFYTLFHEEEGGRYRIQICTDLPCALRGAETFLQSVCAELGVAPGETTSDGFFTVEEVKCLAACHRAPVLQVQGEDEIIYHENQTLETFRTLIEDLRRHGQAQKEGA
ncbi:MAG: NAD(P)H-dependent oxidoreductase subunit E [Anaerolineaceae bacterium]|nr:NAD(P)H-dependent oxidoreductase subunit E [Anaerolineaceae bacterium]